MPRVPSSRLYLFEVSTSIDLSDSFVRLTFFLLEADGFCSVFFFRDVSSLETRAYYRKFHHLPLYKNYFQSHLILLENLEARSLRRRRCHFRHFCHQILTLAHNLSLLLFLRRFIRSRLRFLSGNLLL